MKILKLGNILTLISLFALPTERKLLFTCTKHRNIFISSNKMWMHEKIYLPRQNTKDIYTHYGKIKQVTEEFLCYTKCDGEACVHLLKPQSQAILNNPKMYQCLKYFNMDHSDKVLGLPYHFYRLKISLFLSRTVREIHNPP